MFQWFVKRCFLMDELITRLHWKYDLIHSMVSSSFTLVAKVVASMDHPFIDESFKARNLWKTFGFISHGFWLLVSSDLQEDQTLWVLRAKLGPICFGFYNPIIQKSLNSQNTRIGLFRSWCVYIFSFHIFFTIGYDPPICIST